MFTINSKIDAIKLIRAFLPLGLKDAKILVEAWESAFNNEYQTSDLHQICTLGSICRMFESGDWTINERDEIIARKVVLNDDIRKLRG
jgi:hypothetical protein